LLKSMGMIKEFIPLPEDHGLRPWVNGGSGRRPTRGVKVLGDHVHARGAPVLFENKKEGLFALFSIVARYGRRIPPFLFYTRKYNNCNRKVRAF
jgi:hypothetical protein